MSGKEKGWLLVFGKTVLIVVKELAPIFSEIAKAYVKKDKRSMKIAYLELGSKLEMEAVEAVRGG